MQLKHLALAAMTLAGTAFAQCGLNQLTSPPNFVANNGGAIGGLAYFTLTVAAPNGISICGLELNVGNIGPIGGIVEVHQSISDWNLLAGANNTALDWCTVACVTGTGNGDGTPSPVSIVNSTGTLDLPQGSYLLAIGQGNFNHRYTNGNGLNQTISDPNLTFDGGKGANTPYGASLFSPRVINLTVDYNVAGAAVTLSPCGVVCSAATCVETGTACGGAAATVYELFDGVNAWDLSNDDVVFSASGGTVTVGTATQSAIVPAISPDLMLGDDASSALIPLGFGLDAFGLACTDSISVQSNGCIWLGAIGSGDFSESAAELESQQARLCPNWNDLRPLTGGGGGTIHADVVTGVSCTVTYDQVFIWGGTVPLTFQVEITPTQMLVRYDPASAFASSAIVGFHNGVSQLGTLGSDLNGGAVTPVSGGADLTLTCDSNPVLGGSLDMVLSGVPTIGTVYAQIGLTVPGVALPTPVWAPNCEQYINSGAGSVALGLTTLCSDTFSIAIPNDTAFVGLPYGCQGFAANIPSNLLVASGGIDAVVGNF